MSYREYLVWCEYRNKYGPLNPVRKYDQGSAIVASQINNAHGGKANPIDFMPYSSKPDEDKYVSNDEFLNLIAAGGKNGR